MHWATSVPPVVGQVRAVTRFAWVPTLVENYHMVWLERYTEYQWYWFTINRPGYRWKTFVRMRGARHSPRILTACQDVVNRLITSP